MEYIAGIKYCLTKDEVFQTSVRPTSPIKTRFIDMNVMGQMRVKIGWAWDGCSGPTIDAPWNQRAGCGHDALYWLARNGYLSAGWKKTFDGDFFCWLIEDINVIKKREKKSNLWKSWYKKIAYGYYWAVGKFANAAISPKNKRKKLNAP